MNGVNGMRQTADQTAALFDGCDDPLYPSMLGEGDEGQPFRDWVDFLERVAEPLVNSDGDHAKEQAAMKLYRKASPYFICTALVMAARRAGER